MSSGQQKKALLSYLISQKPQFLVLDDVYSNIDKATQLSITETLNDLSEILKNTIGTVTRNMDTEA